MSTSDVHGYWDAYTAGWADRDPEAVRASFAPGGRIIDPARDEPIAGDGIEDWVTSLIAGFPDVHFEERRVITAADEDRIVVEWTLHGTHTGTFEGLPPTGETVALEGIDVVAASAEGIEEMRIYFDQSSMAEQLGLTFPSIIGQLPTLVVGALRNAL